MENPGAFGSPGSSGDFQIVAFLKKPQVILRLLGWLFSIVVFGCISSSGWVTVESNKVCTFNGVSSACGYGTFVGVVAFLGLMVFLVIDAMFDNLSNVLHRKYVIIADMAFSGIWSFLWFICFCYLTNLWNKTKAADVIFKVHISYSGNQATLAFSFFSIIVFIALTVLAVMRYRQGVSTDFSSTYPDIFGDASDTGGGSSGDAYQGAGDYNQSPFADPSMSGKPPGPAPSQPPAGSYQGQSY
jgi:hypothetical protein